MDENPKTVIEKSFALMACVECGAEAFASCACGKLYKPKEMAARAIADNPDRSDRAIAKELGIGNKTVSRARATVSPDTVDEPRVGLDGKMRRLPVRRHESPDEFLARKRFEREAEAEITPEESAGLKAELKRAINLHDVRLAITELEEVDALDLSAIRRALENLITEAMRALGTYKGLQ